MLAQEIIKKKRDGGVLTSDEIQYFVDGVSRVDDVGASAAAQSNFTDYQASALLMAIFLNGMTVDERRDLTMAMMRSGAEVDFSHVSGAKIDKHSTGGVGDKVSLCLAPLVAACGVPVPMMSGRGLGHTGGTLDKLEAIPGFSTQISLDTFRSQVAEIGMAMIGQKPEIAPADKTLYALRDVTGTVESIDLITASIMSKKLAEGIDGLVLDVKVGSGAFMKTLEDATALAQSMVNIASACGKKAVALLTDMSTPLGLTVGNAIETKEAIDVLRGEGPDDLWLLTQALGAEMLVMGGVAKTLEAASEMMAKARVSGTGLDTFRKCIEAQGGDLRVLDDSKVLPTAKNKTAIESPTSGFIEFVNTEQIGIAALHLGAGRRTVDDKIDPAAGITFDSNHGRHGQQINRGERIATLLHSDIDQQRIDQATAAFFKAIQVRPESPVKASSTISGPSDDRQLGRITSPAS